MIRVLVTRAADDAEPLARGLRALGCEPVLVPTLVRVPVEGALSGLEPADVLLITSPFAATLAAEAGLSGRRVCAVGPATAARARSLGLAVDVVPAEATGVDAVLALGDLRGQTVLYPRAEQATPETAAALRAAGAELTEITAYGNEAPPELLADLEASLPADLLTLLSGSAARRLAATGLPLPPAIAIGPTTAAIARVLGLTVIGVATPHSVAGVIAAVGVSPPYRSARERGR